MAKTTEKTTEPSTDSATAADLQGALIEITCPSGPRRRAGLTFGPVSVTVDESTLTREQAQMLAEDAMLVIRKATPPAETNTAE